MELTSLTAVQLYNTCRCCCGNAHSLPGNDITGNSPPHMLISAILPRVVLPKGIYRQQVAECVCWFCCAEIDIERAICMCATVDVVTHSPPLLPVRSRSPLPSSARVSPPPPNSHLPPPNSRFPSQLTFVLSLPTERRRGDRLEWEERPCWTQSRMHMCIHVCTCMCICICICMYTYLVAHTCTCTYYHSLGLYVRTCVFHRLPDA